MRRIVRLLARLYPSAWRRRYGAEFEALLEDQTLRVRDIFDVLWGAFTMWVTPRSLLRIVLPCGLAGSLVGLMIAFSAPPRYVSETVMTVASRLDSRICEEQNDVPMQLRGPSQGVCEEPAQFVDQRVRDLIRPAFDRAFLVSVMEEMNLYSAERKRMPVDRLVDRMEASIHLVPGKGVRGDSFVRVYDIGFEYPDPRVAQRVNRVLVHHAIETDFKSMIVAAKSESVIAPRLKYTQSFRVENDASLPQSLAGLNWAEQGMVGLLTGLVGGLVLAVAIGSRHDSSAVKG